MKENTESTKFDRLRMAVGTVLAILGALTLSFAVAIGATSLPLIFAGGLFLLSGLLIAGSHRLALFITDLLR